MKLYFCMMIDCSLLPHFLKYYSEKGVDTFITIINGNEEFVYEVKEKSKGYNLVIDRVLPELDNWTKRDEDFTTEILYKYCTPEEFIMLADLDEFHNIPNVNEMDLSNYDWVYSKMIDRFSENGKLNKVNDTNLFEQFPVEKEYTKDMGCVDKVIITRAKFHPVAGHHNLRDAGGARKYHTEYSTKHFKWHEGLLKSLPYRLTQIQEGWRVELEKQMKDFGINNMENYWNEAKGYSIIQRKTEFLKFLSWLNNNCKLDSYLEVGCCGGGTAFYFNKLFKKGLSLDIIPCHYYDKVKNGDNDWEQIVINSNDYKADYYDMVFIDGDHSYEQVKKDYEHFKNHTKIIAFHDILLHNKSDNVKSFWEEIKHHHKYIEIIDFTPSDCIIETTEPWKSTIKNEEWGGIGICMIS